MVAWPLAARAQQPAKIHRIGILETVSSSLNVKNLDALRRGLRESGYVENQNYILEYRSADGHGERFPALAGELVRLHVDLIVTRGTPAAQAAKNATETIPIVMAAIGEPLGVGVVASLARPGGNVTGLSAFVTELAGKRVELVKELRSGSSTVALLHNMGNSGVPAQWEETKKAAKALGIEAVLLDIRSRDDIPRAFETANAQHVDTLLGGLMAYGVSYPDLYFRSATFIDKIFRGAKPGDLPVEQPTKLELIVNLQAAKALGLAVPAALLSRADEVIE